MIEAVRRELDHRYLNDIEGLAVPTLENVARWIWQRLDGTLPGLDRIVVRRGAEGHAEGCTYRAPKRKEARRSRTASAAGRPGRQPRRPDRGVRHPDATLAEGGRP